MKILQGELVIGLGHLLGDLDPLPDVQVLSYRTCKVLTLEWCRAGQESFRWALLCPLRTHRAEGRSRSIAQLRWPLGQAGHRPSQRKSWMYMLQMEQMRGRNVPFSWGSSGFGGGKVKLSIASPKYHAHCLRGDQEARTSTLRVMTSAFTALSSLPLGG